MKKILTLLFPLLCVFCGTVWGQEDPSRFTITGSNASNEVRGAIEHNLFEMFKAFQLSVENDAPLAMPKKGFSKAAIEGVGMLWEGSAFICPLIEVERNLITVKNVGWEVRNIPVTMLAYDEDADKELVVSFDLKGNVTGVDLAMDTRSFRSIMGDGEQVSDFGRRQKILNFVEVFRSAYNRKDVNYLEQVYSDDALIITGRVVRTKQTSAIENKQMYGERIEYVKQDKRGYLTNLRAAFARAKFIDVKFSNIKVQQHSKRPNLYGVTLRQDWTTNTYHDDGYLFLIIDFANEDKPEIHVRTWQPAFKNGKELTEDEVFGLDSFQIGG